MIHSHKDMVPVSVEAVTESNEEVEALESLEEVWIDPTVGVPLFVVSSMAPDEACVKTAPERVLLVCTSSSLSVIARGDSLAHTPSSVESISGELVSTVISSTVVTI